MSGVAGMVLKLAALGIAGVLGTQSAHAADAPPGQDAYSRAQVMVDVGERKINLYCTGKGSPTVLFEADFGRAGWDWAPVHTEVAKRTRACVYDRAGLGFSDPATRASNIGNATKDLRFTLKNNRMSGPYILVGAGYGGAIVQQFARRGGGEVTGVVVLDDATATARPSAESLESARACMVATSKGYSGQADLARSCAYRVSEFAGPALAAAQASQSARLPYWRAYASEIEGLISPEESSQGPRRGGPAADAPAIAAVRVTSPAAVSEAVLHMLDAQK